MVRLPGLKRTTFSAHTASLSASYSVRRAVFHDVAPVPGWAWGQPGGGDFSKGARSEHACSTQCGKPSPSSNSWADGGAAVLGVAADRAASVRRKDGAVSHRGKIQILHRGSCVLTHRSTHCIRYLQSGPIKAKADCDCPVGCVYDAILSTATPDSRVRYTPTDQLRYDLS